MKKKKLKLKDTLKIAIFYLFCGILWFLSFILELDNNMFLAIMDLILAIVWMGLSIYNFYLSKE